MPSPDVKRRSLSIPTALSDRLDEIVRTNNVTCGAVVADALRSWFDRKGDDELELRFATRLDRMARQLARIERNGRIDLESSALFIRYMLTINAPLAEGDDAARAIGRDRFEAFVERVGRQIRAGRITFIPEGEQ